MLAEAMAETRTGKMDPKVGSTLAYMATAWLRSLETDPPTPVNPPVIAAIYRALNFKTTRSTGNTETVKQGQLQAPGADATPGLPAPATEAAVLPAQEEDEIEILDY
jgi:hypothetical protein